MSTLDLQEGLQVDNKYLLWGVKHIDRTYFGLLGASSRYPAAPYPHASTNSQPALDLFKRNPKTSLKGP